MRRVTLKGLLAHKLRLALTALSVVLGVGFVAGTLVLTDTLGHTFDNLFAEVNGHTDAQVRSAKKLNPTDPSAADREPLPARLLDAVKGVDGVAEAGGSVTGFARMIDREGKPIGGGNAPTFGASASNLGTLSPFSIKKGRAPNGSNEAVIDAGTAKSHNLKVGARIKVQSSGPTQTFTVVGIVGFGSADNLAGATFVLFDVPTAQRLLHRQDEFDQISVAAKPGVSRGEIVRRIQAVLPSGYEAVTSDVAAAQAADGVKKALSFFNVFLLVFAAVALFVGAFIIFNTFSIIVAQRSRELALLRALGASRRQVTRSVLAEAVIVGLLASVVGVGFGVVVAAGLRGLLGAFGMDLPHGALVIQAKSVIIPVIVGVVITTLSSWAPARRASRVPPVAAIRGAEMLAPAGSMRRRLIAGGLVLALGLAALARGLFGGGGIALVGVGALIFYIAVAMLSPLVAGRLAQIIGAPAARFRGVPGRLGRQNAMRNPRRTASTAAALMIGLGLVSFVTILAASLKASFAATLERSVKADYIVQGEGQGQQNFSREVAGRLASQSQGTLSVVSPIRLQGEFHLDGALKHDDAVDPYTFTDVMDVDIREGRHDLVDFLPGTMLVSDKVAKDHGWKVGDGAALEFPRTGTQRMQIVAVYHDDALFTNGYIVTLDDFSKNATDDLDSLVLVKRAAGVSDNDARAAVDPIVKDYPTVSLKDQTQFKQDLANQINKLLGLVFVLLFLAVVIAFFGIVNTLALSVFERTRELGLLRAVGMARHQVRRMIRWESIIIAVLGAVLGLGIGAFFGFAAVQAMGDIGVDRMAFPAGQLSVFVIFAALAGVVAAVFPARRAARLDVLAAIAHQ